MNACLKIFLLLWSALAHPLWASSCDEELHSAVVAAWASHVTVIALNPRRGEDLEDNCVLIEHAELLRVEPSIPSRQVTLWWRQVSDRLVPIRLEAEGHVSGWVASRLITKGEPLTASALQARAIPIPEGRELLLSSLDDRLYAATSVADGELLRASMVRTYKPVMAGELVQVSAKHGGATVGFSALSIDDADVGGLATVQTKWGETLHVRITSPGRGSVMP